MLPPEQHGGAGCGQDHDSLAADQSPTSRAQSATLTGRYKTTQRADAHRVAESACAGGWTARSLGRLTIVRWQRSHALTLRSPLPEWYCCSTQECPDALHSSIGRTCRQFNMITAYPSPCRGKRKERTAML
jgi:hypothetical protein